MRLILSADNVVDFLKEQRICPQDFQPTTPIISKESRNFNLVVTSKNGSSFLIKQSRVDSEGRTSGRLAPEWLVQELVNQFREFAVIQPLISEVVLFDRFNSILVSVFYDQYIPLNEYYATCQSYPLEIAQLLGTNLAQVHRATYQKPALKSFLSQHFELAKANKLPYFIERINKLSPLVFAEVCPDGLDFYKLYQRFPSLNQAVEELYAHLQPVCLIHNDLTLDNFIIDSKVDTNLLDIKSVQLKIIDWESVCWGDPAVDLGMIVSQYLSEWLNSLVADPDLEMNAILALASCPLEKITPSLTELLRGYLNVFPEIIEHRPDFVSRIVQFAGIGLIDRLSYYVEYHYPFNNQCLFKLQVAKNLLCNPESGIKTIFGQIEPELNLV